MGAALSGTSVTQNTQAQLQLSFGSAEDLAAHHPAQASQITAAAQSSFLKGDQWAYIAAMVAILIGMALVYRFFPRKKEEEELRAAYQARDTDAADGRQAVEAPTTGEGPAVA
jgi:choline-glycine betaine transporter